MLSYSLVPSNIKTHAGLVRQHNEDNIGWNIDYRLAVLADGMGGHQAGEVASQLAIDSILSSLQDAYNPIDDDIKSDELIEFIARSVEKSNTVIYEAAENNENQKGMGTTLVTFLLHEGTAYIAHVGDSRLYCLNKSGLNQLTHDHSLIQDLIDKGFYSEEEAKSASISHVVTRALGTSDKVKSDIQQYSASIGDIYLLCSDGLSDIVSDVNIQIILSQFDASLEERAEKLIALANNAGGRDNISVILINVH